MKQLAMVTSRRRNIRRAQRVHMDGPGKWQTSASSTYESASSA